MNLHRIPRAAVTFVIAFLAALSPAQRARAADVKPLPIGSPAPDFSLPGVDGKNHALADFNDAKLLLVVFTCNHCPTAQAYEDRIKQLHADYKPKGVALVAISPNDPKALRLDELGYTDVSDSLEDMKIRAKDKGFEFLYLYDGDTQKASMAYGAMATPHVFLFDAERKLRYHGRIDDSEVKEPKSHDLRNALDALLAGRAVENPQTKVFGCSTKWSDKRDTVAKAIEKWNAEPVTLENIDVAGVKALAANADSGDGDGGKLRLINVWATWCAPCIAELPELVDISRMYRNRKFEMVTITMDEMDRKEDALKLLKQHHVSGRNVIFADADKDKLVDALDKEWAGPPPYTVLIAPGGKVLYRENGPIDALKLKKAIADHLGRTYASK